jgi:hypothetical protein
VTDRPYRLRESRVPLEGIEFTSRDLVEMFGGTVTREASGLLAFSMPAQRSVGARDLLDCELTWHATTEPGDDEGVIEIASNVEPQSSPVRTALLTIGVVGALLWLVWPFFPNLGTVSWIGAAVAFAAYFVSLKRSPSGTLYDFLQRLANIQRDARDVDETDREDDPSDDPDDDPGAGRRAT